MSPLKRILAFAKPHQKYLFLSMRNYDNCFVCQTYVNYILSKSNFQLLCMNAYHYSFYTNNPIMDPQE